LDAEDGLAVIPQDGYGVGTASVGWFWSFVVVIRKHKVPPLRRLSLSRWSAPVGWQSWGVVIAGLKPLRHPKPDP